MVVFKRPVRGAVATSGASSPRYGSGGMSSSPGPGGSDPYSPSTPGMSAPGGRGQGPGPGMFDPVQQPGGRGPRAEGFKVIALKHAPAPELAATLKQLFANVQVVGDARSNSIILKAEPAAARELEELIRKLDVRGNDEAGGAGGGSPASGRWWSIVGLAFETNQPQNPGQSTGVSCFITTLHLTAPAAGPPSRSVTSSMIQRLTSRSMSGWMRCVVG